MGRMPDYSVFLKIEGRWQRIASLSSDNSIHAYAAAVLLVPAEHRGKSIRVEEIAPPPGAPDVRRHDDANGAPSVADPS